MIRVLVIFAEINYDKNPKNDPIGNDCCTQWKKGKLPDWKDDFFDPLPSAEYRGMMTKFFAESSFGNYLVLGDYVDSLIIVNESEVRSLDYGNVNKKIFSGFADEKNFKTRSALRTSDFDNWTLTRHGLPKISPGTDSPMKWDHVMVIYHNLSTIPSANGRASEGSIGKIAGFNSDSYSVFTSYDGIPFNIARHEFCHLLFGGNNFHVGGGQSSGLGPNFFIPIQGGWSMMGAAGSSLLTCNGWDRQRMQWKHPEKKFLLSAMDESGTETETDLDAEAEKDERIFVLRDFITTGDVLRIKLPHIPADEFPQWLWFENHQAASRNGSTFDRFMFEDLECAGKAVPGIYVFLQVERHQASGKNIFGGYADYLRPVPADGFYDLVFDSVQQKNNCGNNVMYFPFERKQELTNPLTGNSVMEGPRRDLNNDNHISKNEVLTLYIEKTGNSFRKNLPAHGTAASAFTKAGNSKIGIDRNPSSANMMTLVNSNENHKGGSLGKTGYETPNNRKIYLSGVSAEILEELPGGSIKIKVRFDDADVLKSTRWCADTIVVPPKPSSKNYSLRISEGAEVRIDRGITPTRIIKPDTTGEEKFFTNPSVLYCPANTVTIIEKGAKLILDDKSTLHLAPGSTLIVSEGARVFVKNNSLLKLEPGSRLEVKTGARVYLGNKKSLVREKGSIIKKSSGGKISVKKNI